MAIETFYKTSDGKIFNDYVAADSYEKYIIKELEKFFALDYDGNKITNSEINGENIRRIYYVELLTESAYQIFKKLSERYGVVCPDGKGIWLYDFYDWINLESEFEELIERWNKDENISKRLKLKLEYELMEVNK